MEIGLMTPLEWPWVEARSVTTALAQVHPALRELVAPEAVSARARAMLRHALMQPGSAVFMARESGTQVGYLIHAVVPDELTGAPTGLFFDIWVEPEWRGRGLSSLLTAAGEAECRRQGLRLVRRWISSHNAPSVRHAQSDGCVAERTQFLKLL